MTVQDPQSETGWPAVTESTEIREKTIDVLQRMLEGQRMMALPDPPATLDRYRQKLEANQYSVLVVGEAKRGKSSFINALIGRDILPTDVGIATSQVFRVSRADEDAFRLRFEDDSARQISAEELEQYGSEVDKKKRKKAPRPDEAVRWIEVDVPVRFLPPGVSIIDTPGLGSLHSRHAEVTQRVVPHADAVIFVLDSSGPMTMDEVQFVHALLEVTPSIFFIQTKTDLHRKEHWQKVLERNGEILASQFEGRLANARVWPISSQHLLTAAETQDDDYLVRSGHPEMAAALQQFLLAAAGVGRCAEAIPVAEQYFGLGHATLAGRMSSVLEESKQRRGEVQQRVQQRSQQFDRDWGPNGQKYNQLMVSIRDRITSGKRGFDSALLPKSKLFLGLQRRINSLSTIDEANQFGEGLVAEVIGEVGRAWRQTCDRVQHDCDELLLPFVREASMTGAAIDMSDLGGPDIEGEFHPATQSAMDILNISRGQTMITVWLSGTGMTAMATLGLIAPPVAAIGALIIGAAFIGRNWEPSKAKLVEQAKAKLLQFLQNDIRPQVHQYFFAVDLDRGQSSLVDEYFGKIERALGDQVRNIVRQKLEEAQAEINRMREEDTLNESQRRDRARLYQSQLAAWDALGGMIQPIRKQLEATGHRR